MKTNTIVCDVYRPKTTRKVVFATYGVYFKNIICIGNKNVNFPNEESRSKRFFNNAFSSEHPHAWTSKFTREREFYRTPYKQTVKKLYKQKFTYARIVIWIPYSQIGNLVWSADWAFKVSKDLITETTNSQYVVNGHIFGIY